MGRCRIVRPAVVRLPLSDGDYLDVKKELNAGEYLDLITDMVERKPFSKILAYVVGWSLLDVDGQALPFSPDVPGTLRRDTVRSLDKETMRELAAVLDRHEEAEDAKKKSTGGEIASSATLQSVAG